MAIAVYMPRVEIRVAMAVFFEKVLSKRQLTTIQHWFYFSEQSQKLQNTQIIFISNPVLQFMDNFFSLPNAEKQTIEIKRNVKVTLSPLENCSIQTKYHPSTCQ